MIYDYAEKKGYVSLWIGKCKNFRVIDDYLSTEYFDEEFESDEEAAKSELWRNIFIPANQSRVYEDELKDCFNYEFFNQFEYDFGLTFDEDFREANVLDQETVDLEVLFDGFSDSDSFIKKIETLNFDVKEGYNTAVVLYNFKYEGDVCEVRHNDLYLCFLGYLKYSSQ